MQQDANKRNLGIDAITIIEGTALVPSSHGYFSIIPRLKLRPRTACVAEYTFFIHER